MRILFVNTALYVEYFIFQYIGGRKFFVTAWKSILHKSANMDVLISLGGLISYLYSVAVLLHAVLTLKTGPVEVVTKLIGNI